MVDRVVYIVEIRLLGGLSVRSCRAQQMLFVAVQAIVVES